MNLSELIEKVAEKAPFLSKEQVRDGSKLIIESFKLALKKGKEIQLREIGSFSNHEYSSTKARNPKTGESVFLPARKRPRFKISRRLRRRLNPEGS